MGKPTCQYKYRPIEVSSKLTDSYIYYQQVSFTLSNTFQAPTMFQVLGRIKISKIQALQKFMVEGERQTYQKATPVRRDDSFNCSVRTEGLMRVFLEAEAIREWFQEKWSAEQWTKGTHW